MAARKTTDLTALTATTSAAGIVQLNDNINSTSTTQAATANAVKTAYDLANGRGRIVLGTPHGPHTRTAEDHKPRAGPAQ